MVAVVDGRVEVDGRAEVDDTEEKDDDGESRLRRLAGAPVGLPAKRASMVGVGGVGVALVLLIH